MTREEALKQLKLGNKITHRNFTPDEFYQYKDGKIIAEDGFNHTRVFHSTEHNNWRKDGWELYQP